MLNKKPHGKSYDDFLNQINLNEEDGYVETQENKFYSKETEVKSTSTTDDDLVKTNIWYTTIEKYLNSVEYAFVKGNKTSKKFSDAFDKIPEPTSKKYVMHLTLFFIFLALSIFLASCQALKTPFGDDEDSLTSNSNYSEKRPYNLPSNEMGFYKKSKYIPKENDKGKEQLYVKRENIIIKSRDSGSTTGSIWADSTLPKSLATEYLPTRVGEIITVKIPTDLQFIPKTPLSGAGGKGKTTAESFEPVKAFKFEIINLEPTGDVYLRGIKNYITDNGEQRNVIIMAKIPRRNLNTFEIDARELTQIAVNDIKNGLNSDYATTGWDLTVSRKISDYTPDSILNLAEIEKQKKDLEVEQNALKDQKKAFADEAERLKKDRARLAAAETQTTKKQQDNTNTQAAANNQAPTQNANPVTSTPNQGGNNSAANPPSQNSQGGN